MLAVVGPSWAKVDKPAYGDGMITGSIGDASILIPGLASDSASSGVNGLVYDGLVKYDKDLNIVGVVAKSWTISKDEKVITFHLHKNVKWHDGKPFTAIDCLFTYRFMTDPKTPTPYRSSWNLIKKVEVIDDYTLRVTMKKTFAKALITWGMGMLPRHLLKGKDPRQNPLARRPIGTGPFRFLSWKSGQRIILTANKDYFDGRPYLDRTITRIIPDMATMFLELKAGNLDMMGLTPLQWMRQTRTGFFKKFFKKYKYLAFAYTYLGFNLKKKIFQDRRVRLAITYGINKGELIDGVLLGLGQRTVGPYKPGTWAYNTRLRPYPFDPEKALALLAQAGWKRGKDGKLRNKKGDLFTFTIITNQGNQNRKNTALIIQQRLKQIGVTVKLRVIEWTVFLKEYVDKRRFDAVILGWTIPPDPDGYDVWHSSRMAKGGLNFVSFSNPEVDRLLVKARHTLSRKVRKPLYDRFQDILHREAPYVFLYVPDSLTVVHRRFRNIKPAVAGIDYNFIRWYVPKAEQKHKFRP